MIAKLLLSLRNLALRESNSDVRILIGRSKIAVYAQEQYQFGENSSELSTGAASGGLQVAMQCNFHLF